MFAKGSTAIECGGGADADTSPFGLAETTPGTSGVGADSVTAPWACLESQGFPTAK
jgi:hypothetical protein